MPVNVLYDITTLGAIHAAKASPGGIFQHVERLGLALARNPNVNLFVGAREGQEGKVIRYIAETGNFSQNAAALVERGFEAQVRAVSAEIAHINWRGAETLPEIANTRVLFTLPDIIAVKAPQYFAKDGQKNSAREYMLSVLSSVTPAHELIVSGEKVKRDILQRFGRIKPAQINVAPLGHNLAQEYLGPISSEVEDAFQQSGSFKVLCLNTIEPRKNMRSVLRALVWLDKNHPKLDLKIVLIGARGWLNEEFYEEISRLDEGIRSRLVFLGFVSNDEVKFSLKNSDLFLFPSFDEGFGLPILEAMAAGLPVVTSLAVACRETAGNHSVAVNGNSSAELGQKIWQISQGGANVEAVAKAGQVYAQSKTWDWSAHGLADVYLR